VKRKKQQISKLLEEPFWLLAVYSPAADDRPPPCFTKKHKSIFIWNLPDSAASQVC
jgi:hypothetical protein